MAINTVTKIHQGKNRVKLLRHMEKPTVFVPLPQIATNSEKSLATNYTNSTKLFRVIREIRGKSFRSQFFNKARPRLTHWLSKLILGYRIYEPMD